ncbi:lipid IV(A) palmitoyltransferase PagP [Legionella sp. W05-934-2]|jgi:palmitoyl transferase|uniref:lipid IV(A) palmitoyltransferase PagP n=1 Tax=Legionella sp. W05-934-2 TaxID=1198649 RepID=UPI0034628ABA
MRKKGIVGLLWLLILSTPVFADSSCDNWPSWFQWICIRSKQIINEGDNAIVVSGYAWHNRNYYTPEKIKTYNEKAWGGGLGRGFYDEKHNWHGYYGLVFLDSHKNLEPNIGYAYFKVWEIGQTPFELGLGYTAIITARADLNKGRPFPGVLPLVSFGTKTVTAYATYIPGRRGIGNVLFIFGKITFGS